jgi:hypothetical protein
MARLTCRGPSAPSTRGSLEPPPVCVRCRRVQRSRSLPTTRRGPRPRGQHAGGHVQHGITQRSRGHRLTDQPPDITHAIGHARIEPLRSTDWAVAPDSPTRASPTPPRPPPTRVATARARIGLRCSVVIVHIELLSALVSAHIISVPLGPGPRRGDFIDTPTPGRGASPQKLVKNRPSVFRCLCWSPQMRAVSGRHDMEPKGHSVPERSTPENSTRPRPGRPHPRGHALSDLTRPVESVDVQRRTRSRQCPPRRQGIREGYSAYYIGHTPWGRGGQPQGYCT